MVIAVFFFLILEGAGASLVSHLYVPVSNDREKSMQFITKYFEISQVRKNH